MVTNLGDSNRSSVFEILEQRSHPADESQLQLLNIQFFVVEEGHRNPSG
jgi:hypothetical protein